MNEFGRYDTTTLLERALPIVEQSHRVLANNIANANTPGFSPTHVSFSETLKNVMAGVDNGVSLRVTHPDHIAGGASPTGLVLEQDSFEPGRNDQSTLDIDREMVALLKNNARYNMFSAILTKRYQGMREVLRMP